MAKNTETIIYADDEICLKKTEEEKFFVEFGGKEYPIKNMIQSDIDETYPEWYVTFIQGAKVNTDWEFSSFSDNTCGIELTDPDTGEKKFYWHADDRESYMSDDGEEVYEADLISDGPFPSVFVVGFVKHEGLNPERIGW